MTRDIRRISFIMGLCLSLVFGLISLSHAGDDEDFKISEVKWDDEDLRLKIKGKGREGKIVQIYNKNSTDILASGKVDDDDEWKIRIYNLATVPCGVKAIQSDGQTDVEEVEDAPDNCDDGTSTPPPEPPPTVSGNFTILAANDLGMHCADQDYRIFSILPPYNVLNAQVLRKGDEPEMMSPADGVHVTYKAINSNYFESYTDPNSMYYNSITSTGTNITSTDPDIEDIFKNNFWTVDGQTSETGIDKIGWIAYELLYPEEILSWFESAPDLGLPAPNLVELYFGSGELTAEQSAMPGVTNTPQPFHGYVENYPFFVDFPFGYTVSNFKRYTAEGIPISPIDDKGNLNPYPLMRIEARDDNDNILASVDTVVPVASEADCQICHASQPVCDIKDGNSLLCDDIANTLYNADFIETTEQALAVIGDTIEQKIINSAKLNIVRLHDIKHETTLAGTNADGTNPDGKTPNIVCANCHYSPALDLAHLGPNDTNGKEQTKHISMSRAMHGVHGALATDPNYDGLNLFPTMPPPGASRDPMIAESTLMETCYNCHPGKSAKCLRGAMGGSGTVCQDCHGQMTQVGDDFTGNFPNVPFPDPGSADLTKRVSWASEPTCDSCHVGDVMQTEQLRRNGALDDTVFNTTDSGLNSDNLRLLLAYKLSDHKSNGGPDNLKLLKFPESRFATTEALYRLSGADNGSDKGHGGLSCEGCHGSTHAIWPNNNPNANDNKAANDLQGHSGPIIECDTCHEGDLGNTLDGPHGMHPVGDSSFSDGGHEDMAEKNNGDSCRACHGLNGEGSVLSRVATKRTLSNEGKNITIEKGDVVTCTLCHDNEL